MGVMSINLENKAIIGCGYGDIVYVAVVRAMTPPQPGYDRVRTCYPPPPPPPPPTRLPPPPHPGGSFMVLPVDLDCPDVVPK